MAWMRLTLNHDELPRVVQRCLEALPRDRAAEFVVDGPSDVDAEEVFYPTLAGAYVLGRLAAAGALPVEWPATTRLRMADFVTALPARIARHSRDVQRHPFAADPLRGQFWRRVDREAQTLLAEAEALAGPEPAAGREIVRGGNP